MKIMRGMSALVSGASSGIGRALALELGRRGAKVALLARSREPLEDLAREVREAGGEALVTTADVRSEDQVRAAVANAVETFGNLRLVIANAGLGRYAAVEEQPEEHVETTIETNYVGMTRLARLTVPHLLQSAPAHFVGITSSAGLIPHRVGSAYCASKAASNAYLAALRLEVFDRGVGVSWICPGLVTTPFIEKAELEPDKDLPLLARLTVRRLEVPEVVRATMRAIEGNRREVTLPLMMRFFAFTRRATPSFADWLQRKTG